ncbi:MAG: chemotaxis protein CheB [Bacteroidetes bacterium]|nr:chemotaxis protein CheB [Bacteroidota bacterium]
MNKDRKYGAVVIGVSAGGLNAVSFILKKLPVDYKFPIIIIQHRNTEQRDLLEDILQEKSKMKLKQADEKEKIKDGVVYIAPPDYHLLIENDYTFSLSSDARVKFSRPSIDVLFESASYVYKEKLVGIILTGANNDGSDGIIRIAKKGGVTLAQNPDEAEFPVMPQAAIATGYVKHIFSLLEIQKYLLKINQE